MQGQASGYGVLFACPALCLALPTHAAERVWLLGCCRDKDIICNIVGNRRWVDALQWGRAEEWAEAQDQTWEVDGQEAGQVSEVGPLSFVRVYDAGGWGATHPHAADNVVWLSELCSACLHVW